MEIFNIHLFELLLIAGLALVVFGPERLPELGRFAGKQVARFLAWQQQSPELKVINDVRSEFEQEIASLRDELVRTRRQLDISREVDLNGIRDELRPMLSLRDELKSAVGRTPASPAAALDALVNPPTADPAPGATLPADPAPGAAAPAPAVDQAPSAMEMSGRMDPASLGKPGLEAADSAVGPSASPAGASPAGRPPPAGTVPTSMRPNRLAATAPTNVLSQPDGQSSLQDSPGNHSGDPTFDHALPDAPSLNGQHRAPGATPFGDASDISEAEQRLQAGAPGPAGDELRLALAQIERLSADLHALVSALHERGLLGADWQPGAAISEQETPSR